MLHFVYLELTEMSPDQPVAVTMDDALLEHFVFPGNSYMSQFDFSITCPPPVSLIEII